jgi:hypothetical protein
MVATSQMKTRCRYCDAKIDSETPGVYQYVKGWERRRAGGGTNAIRLPERVMMFACHACIEAHVRGYAQDVPLF